MKRITTSLFYFLESSAVYSVYSNYVFKLLVFIMSLIAHWSKHFVTVLVDF